MSREGDLRAAIEDLVRRYVAEVFAPKAFEPASSDVPVSGKVFGAEEVVNAVNAALDGWWTAGRFTIEFERRLASVLPRRHVLMTNSGSSANLLAVAALCAPELGERRLQPGDEVITTATCFPTTVAPMVQSGLVPVFVDVNPGTYNADGPSIAAALSPKTKAVVLAHTLGNPFDVKGVTEACAAHGLWLVEDTCDALGGAFLGRSLGTFGDLATFSFYPAHHITTGEGGAVATDRGLLKVIAESLRDWGRACWCEPGRDNTCRKRFGWDLGDLPAGYDHKYTYSRLGYNLKATDFQAAIGVAQLGRLSDFNARRRRNFERLMAGLRDQEDDYVLPQSYAGADPSWFGFPLTVRDEAPFSRQDLVGYLEERRIRTRVVFTGNAVRQPAFKGVTHRVVGDLPNADRIMHGSFWIGLGPLVTDTMIDYVLESLWAFRRARRRPGTRVASTAQAEGLPGRG